MAAAPVADTQVFCTEKWVCRGETNAGNRAVLCRNGYHAGIGTSIWTPSDFFQTPEIFTFTWKLMVSSVFKTSVWQKKTPVGHVALRPGCNLCFVTSSSMPTNVHEALTVSKQVCSSMTWHWLLQHSTVCHYFCLTFSENIKTILKHNKHWYQKVFNMTTELCFPISNGCVLN